MKATSYSPARTATTVPPTHRSTGAAVPANGKQSVAIDVTSEVLTDGEGVPSQSEEAQRIPSPQPESAYFYDPEAIAAFQRRRPIRVWFRLWSIVWSFLSFGLSLMGDRLTKSVERNEKRRAAQLRITLTDLGPAFIKIGQALSTRPDLVPPFYLEELTTLQDQLPPFPNQIAYGFIEEELGGKPEEIYAEISANPVAAASLGQVYKGKLKTGETVAIKVQRPGLAERIALDVYILRQLAIWMTNALGDRLKSDLVGIMDEFATRIYQEMDYTQEGQNAETFRKLYGHLKDIYVPKIYWQYTHHRVLTMEWIDGMKLTQIEALKAANINATYLIEVGVQCSLRQLLEHGFFHADPHPGNLLATPNGKLAYLDFGMMSEVKEYQRYGLIEAVVHLVNREFESLAEDYIKLEFLAPGTDLRPIVPALAEVFNNALGASVAELNFKSITDQLSALMYEYPFRVPAYYALIIRSLVTLEGIAINIDPEFKVLSKAYPYVAKRLLTDTSPQLQSSLRSLLFKDGSFRWNRLENLLRNARNSDDYDINRAIDQTIDFIFSERGTFVREYLATELVNGLDRFSQNTLTNARATLEEWLGAIAEDGNNAPDTAKSGNGNGFQNGTAIAPQGSPQSATSTQNLENIQRIWQILQETPGFEPTQLVQLVPGLLMKPEVRQLGQRVAGDFAQRAIVRLIREVLISDEEVEKEPLASL